jgi:hypothetical protein
MYPSSQHNAALPYMPASSSGKLLQSRNVAAIAKSNSSAALRCLALKPLVKAEKRRTYRRIYARKRCEKLIGSASKWKLERIMKLLSDKNAMLASYFLLCWQPMQSYYPPGILVLSLPHQRLWRAICAVAFVIEQPGPSVAS